MPSSSAASSGLYASRSAKARSRSRVDALNLAERCRTHIAAMSIPVEDDAESGPFVKVTISVGVAALDGASFELTGMLAAADAALYQGDGP
jgi:PleD family two-component response regulator